MILTNVLPIFVLSVENNYIPIFFVKIFRIGSNIIACGENEEFSDVPQCVDKDECPDARY